VHLDPAKPLVVMTPKSLLRAPAARSRAADFESGSFRLLLGDPQADASAARLILCSGKIALDLFAFRAKHAIEGTAIARFEQFYPFPTDDLLALLQRHSRAKTIRWVQEEPSNMGGWTYMLEKLRERLPSGLDIGCVARPRSGSPATGSQAMHAVEQEMLLQQALLG
jgi:2-oxoglutarate dehydrogenase complex dehydrogenase (E1) component-like enzyme